MGEVETTLAVLRRARAQAAVSRIRLAAAEIEAERLSDQEIEAEMTQAREERRSGVGDVSTIPSWGD